MKTLSLATGVVALVLVSAPDARAQEASDDFRLQQKRNAEHADASRPPEANKPADGEKAPHPDVVQPTPSQPGPQPPDHPKNPWELSLFGYLRAGYDFTFKDSRYAFVGRNNGFILDSARVGVDGRYAPLEIAWRVSVEGASDVQLGPNTPIGSLSVRLRDAFARWDPVPWLGMQVGQFKAPFQEEELRGTNTLMFASRSVGVEGVPTGRGFETAGIQLDRQVGVMLSPAKPIGGDVAASYYLMVMNGNGGNQLLDDNGRFGLVGRTELGYKEYARLGAAVFHNERTVGTPPNLYNETDVGMTGDLALKIAGLHVLGAVTRLRTTFPTVGTDARIQLAFVGQAGYRFDFPQWFIMPAYRFAYFHPWMGGADETFDAFRVQYHTFGVRTGLAKIPVQAWLNYTLTAEAPERSLTNDRIELLGQVTF